MPFYWLVHLDYCIILHPVCSGAWGQQEESRGSSMDTGKLHWRVSLIDIYTIFCSIWISLVRGGDIMQVCLRCAVLFVDLLCSGFTWARRIYAWQRQCDGCFCCWEAKGLREACWRTAEGCASHCYWSISRYQWFVNKKDGLIGFYIKSRCDFGAGHVEKV